MRSIPLAVIVLLLFAFAGANVLAFGSSEKTPEEKAAESKKHAVEKYNNGVKHMRKAREITAKGDSASAYNYRATSDAKATREYEKAIKDFREAVKSDPDMIEAHNNLAFCYRKIGRFEKSLTAYNAALALDSTFAQAREYRGELYLAIGEIEKAREELNFLDKMESPYADTLSASIELYRLQQIEEKMEQ